jgi:hypothetical protein
MKWTIWGAALVTSVAASRKSVVLDANGKFVLISGVSPAALVTVSYDADAEGSGWGYLEIVAASNGSLSTEGILQTYRAAGYAEGVAACVGLIDQYPNFYHEEFGDDPPPSEVVQFIADNYDFMDGMVNVSASTSEYWFNIQSSLEQLKGIVEGYAASPCASGAPPSYTVANWTNADVMPGASLLGGIDYHAALCHSLTSCIF